MADIIVVGSSNVDMHIRINQSPSKGQTVLAESFYINSGGKGANQAYAAAKLGGDVLFISAIGNDVFKEKVLSNLKSVCMDTSLVHEFQEKSTGVAFVLVDEDGDNRIIVSPNANEDLTPDIITRNECAFKGAKLLIIQLEVPIETVITAISIAKKHNVKVLLDPAPYKKIPEHLFNQIDYITPNQTEIELLTGINVTNVKTARLAASKLLNKGVGTVFAKLGHQGLAVVNSSSARQIEGISVKVIDTTAAGDAFAGAVGYALIKGEDIYSAAIFGNIVGAMTVTRKGAQESIPNKEDISEFITKNMLKVPEDILKN